MRNILKSKKALLLIGLGLFLCLGTLFAIRNKSVENVEGVLVEKEKAAVPSNAIQPSMPFSESEEMPIDDTNVSLPEVQSTLGSLQKVFLGMKSYKDREKSKDQKLDKAEKEELSKKRKELQREARKMIRGSEIAQKELLKTIKEEKDPYVKKELSRLFRELDPGVQLNYAKELAIDSSSDNQKAAVEMLSNLRTKDSLVNLVGMADNSSLGVDVRGDVVQGIGRSIPFSDDGNYQAEARGALQGFVQPQYPPEVRESAYRSIAMQTTLTPEDERFITQAAQQETDPKVSRMAQFAQKVIEARNRSAFPKVN